MKNKEKLMENVPVCIMSTARNDASLAAEKLKQRVQNLNSNEGEIISNRFDQYEKEKDALEEKREKELSEGGDADEINRIYDTMQIEATDKLGEDLKSAINNFAKESRRISDEE